ncbi:MAG: nucleotidyltransferase domain-containing protein [Planctomycetes bacterium]|nr:nucleotidyltransferase domain-containing protein [Planctomycetota bacterium]
MEHPALIAHSKEIRELCTRNHVCRLELFGSAARGQDKPTSDFDFIVEMEDLPPVEYGRCYFNLLFGLEDLLGRRVELLTLPSITNPYFLKEIESDRSVVYEESRR